MIRAVYHKDSAQAPAGRALAAALVGQMAAPANKPAKQAAVGARPARRRWGAPRGARVAPICQAWRNKLAARVS